jgi:hypothetical protein
MQKGHFEVLPTLPAPQDRGYRIRAQLKASIASDRTILGFYGIKSHQVVEIGQCPLLHPLADEILREIDGELQRFKEGIPLWEVEIFVSPDEDKGIVHLRGDGPKVLKMAEKFFQKSRLIKGIKLTGTKTASWGDLRLRFRLPGLACVDSANQPTFPDDCARMKLIAKSGWVCFQVERWTFCRAKI